MRLTPLLLLCLLVAGPGAPMQRSAGDYDATFTRDTMRIDYFHTGGPAAPETLSLDRVLNDGAWPGSRTQLVDPTGLGAYVFEARDTASGTLIYSRGFSSIYGEWETTGEQKTAHRTFHESVRMPWPKRPIAVTLKKRHADGAFRSIWTVDIDPASRFVNRAPAAPHAGRVWTVFENGPPSQKVDLLIVGEGYTSAEMPKFRRDVERLLPAVFGEEPFKSRRSEFNVRALELPSAQSGIHRPNAGMFRRTPLSAEYNIFDSERYVLTLDNRALRDAAAAAPYEFIEILVNEKTYGGGGIFNAQATASVDSAFSPYVFVHEFGHHFAALADEYYTSPAVYAAASGAKIEPWEPNVTALHDPAAVKWRARVTPGTALPTPWPKAEFEAYERGIQSRRVKLRADKRPEAEMTALFKEEAEGVEKIFDRSPVRTVVGAFEGGNYEATGYFRPQLQCLMFDRVSPFCGVCSDAIVEIIELYSKPE